MDKFKGEVGEPAELPASEVVKIKAELEAWSAGVEGELSALEDEHKTTIAKARALLEELRIPVRDRRAELTKELGNWYRAMSDAAYEPKIQEELRAQKPNVVNPEIPNEPQVMRFKEVLSTPTRIRAEIATTKEHFEHLDPAEDNAGNLKAFEAGVNIQLKDFEVFLINFDDHFPEPK